jgi:hypothetical protein
MTPEERAAVVVRSFCGDRVYPGEPKLLALVAEAIARAVAAENHRCVTALMRRSLAAERAREVVRATLFNDAIGAIVEVD